CNGDMREVQENRTKRLFKARDLYPEGYDLDTLFVDFKTRKRERDLNRGSKKALKNLRRENSQKN
ncbi:MAG: hypothetical protein ACRCWY_11160, partial [Cellulosilyticaceae bacterium]